MSPWPTDTIGCITSHFVSLDFDAERTPCYIRCGAYRKHRATPCYIRCAVVNGLSGVYVHSREVKRVPYFRFSYHIKWKFYSRSLLWVGRSLLIFCANNRQSRMSCTCWTLYIMPHRHEIENSKTNYKLIINKQQLTVLKDVYCTLWLMNFRHIESMWEDYIGIWENCIGQV